MIDAPVTSRLAFPRRQNPTKRPADADDRRQNNLNISSTLAVPFVQQFLRIICNMHTTILTLVLVYTVRTMTATATPYQSSDVWAEALQGIVLPNTNSNTTLGLALDASPLLNASGLAVTCLAKTRAYRPILVTDYYQAVQQILIRDDALLPQHFRLGPEGSVRQDYYWQGGQAAIAFFSSQPLRTDAFPIIVVAHVAALIADNCVTEAQGHLGGYARIGPNRGTVGVGNVNIPDARTDDRTDER